eukprot:m.159668 g.159668  ORF g.159668 m.159668 type:complete len:298 (-) comp31146_c0_seq1:196-1089(-)
MNPNMQYNLTLTIFGLIQNAERVIEPRIKDLIPLACTPGWHVTLRIMEGGSTDNTRALLNNVQLSPPKCKDNVEGRGDYPSAFDEVDVFDEPTLGEFESESSMVRSVMQGENTRTPQRLGKEDMRILRLARLRDFMRDRIRRLDSNRSVVLLVDFDLEKFPDIVLLRAHIWRLAHPQAPFDAVCANGKTAYRLRIWKGLKYYDVFATLLLNGSYPMKTITDPATKPATKEDITARLTQEIDNTAGLMYPVQSCFGGMTIYKPEVYFDTRCNYSRDLSRSSKHSVFMGNNQWDSLASM